ncbi:chymotrypsinogen B-like [Penaeus chinensis]|uniref:chymotrypsinogen B-like n=1 Tax=Penaeus chinensis TaxID=139456 RepID=UPI001FB6E97F|nr:chymotrypsinogen B-like [Penaeus chinensis]XP_047487783.1 chymotrypsinogen B-like [Penaeus chinensis]XP_047487784.1 chymotrypsinogen B-like [Penaeus chinensis]XP_047487785.1 chymotrypsinogen B-like [Penaeus chinensis]XP_047487786.1 chymotrypsinogen B-like [Penaeus chinensis]XP_047487787.1 chymotrypsinogen B-like [Penaeus chinensis]XP_047487788.1 chymotrypsinogen B-like [Penaeus chinensis]
MWEVLLLLVGFALISPSQGKSHVSGKKMYIEPRETEDKSQELSESPAHDRILNKCRNENRFSSRRTLALCLRKHGVRGGKGSVERNGKAKCGKTYKLKRGARRTFRIKGNEDFCEAFFEPRGNAELQLLCRQFDLSDCNEEYFTVTDLDSEEKFCNNEGPDERKGLETLRLTYQRVSKVTDGTNILCVVRGVKVSGGGGGGSSGATQAPGCKQVCGKAPRNAGATKIVGGQASQPGEYPWMVRLSIRDGLLTYLCGGSIITSLHIITAAHCVDYRAPEVTVMAGEHNVETEDESITQTIGAKKVAMHPKFDATTSANDIAVITLQSPLEWTDDVGPICLPPDKTFANSEAVIVGWGLLNYQDLTLPDELQEAGVTVFDHGECKSAHAFSNFPVTDKHICAADPGQIACRGDSGGPLMTKKNRLWLLLGVTSFGPEDCSSDVPAVYTRVSSYSEWILNKLSKGSC